MSRISSEDRLVMEELERKKRKAQEKEDKKSDREILKQKKKQEKQDKKERRKQNNEIMKSTIFFALIFFAMVGYYAYFVSMDSESVVNNSYNSRLKSYANTVVRGSIYTSNGKKIAYTDTDKKGNETRVYPYDGLFAHVVGMNTHGKTGIEKLCDYYLLTTNTNPIQKVINEFREKKSEGNDVVTTLNLKLQKAAYESLGKNDGAVVVLDNDTGKILAMVSKPDYDPNQLEDMWEEINEEGNTDSFLLNRATQGLYTPGSIFKIFTTLEYIRSGQDYEKFSYNCKGSKTFDDYKIKCYDGHAHGKEDLKDAFAYSCNGAFATIGTTLDIGKMNEDLKQMLFNTKLPVSIEYKKSKFDLEAGADTFAVTQTSIGQGTTLVTPIHMAMMVQAIANNGKMMTPYLISEIDGHDGAVLKSYEPKSYKTIMTKKEAGVLKEMMEAVTEYGTGKILAKSKYTCGGKTGTAQIDTKGNVNSWFIGYANKGKKNISVCVVIENVPDGSTKAVKSAKEIFDAYFIDS